MPDTISKDTPKRGKRAISLEEWAETMTRLYRIIDLELGSIEKVLNKNKDIDEKTISDADRGTRRLLNAVRAVGYVHGINKDVEEGEVNRIREILHESDEARAELDRKLARVLERRKSRSSARGDHRT